MEGGGAEGDEGAEVLRGGVSLVRGEAVAGMRGVERREEAVAVDLGDDGGGGDGERERVAVDEAGLRAGVGKVERSRLHGVDEQVVWRDGEGADGGQHGEARGLVDVDAVDGGGVDLGDGEGEGGGADEAV